MGILLLITLIIFILDAAEVAKPGAVYMSVLYLLGAGLSASAGWMCIGQIMAEAYPTAIRGLIKFFI